MEYTKEIKKAMNYIENNLNKEIRTEEIADSAGFSKEKQGLIYMSIFKKEDWQKLRLFFVTPTYVFLILPCTYVLNLRRYLQEHSRRFMACRRGSIEKR